MQASHFHPVPSVLDSTPGDVVALMAGGTNQVLQGFSDDTAIRGSWLHPAVPFIPTRQLELLIPVMDRSVTRWRQAVWGLGGLAILLVGMGLGVLGALMQMKWQMSDTTGMPAWKISGVVPQGVKIVQGGSTILVPVGSRLPNGESVVSVFPDRNVVVLENSTVLLRSPVTPSPSKEAQ